MNNAKPLVFFVPGIMGSTLRYQGEGELGEWTDKDVWGSDPGTIVDVLARWPRRLTSPQLQPTEVLKFVRGRVYGKKVDQTFYGPLLDFCVDPKGLALERDVEFIPFPYDWRMDNRDSAKRLAAKIEAVDPEGNRPTGLVAHSMGGLVCRLLLLMHPTLAPRVRFFLQIASPVLGAAKAFQTLREGPSFSSMMDLLIGWKHHLNPQAKSDLDGALRTFPSIYQLLPPSRVPILLTAAGRQMAGVADEVWLQDARPHLQAARTVHGMLEQAVNVPITCVYSSVHDTIWHYRVDEDFRIKAWYQEPFGDGTVSSASAFEGSDVSHRVRIGKGDTTHDELPRHPEVENILRSLVSDLRKDS